MPKVKDPFNYNKGGKGAKHIHVENAFLFFDVVGFTKDTTVQDMRHVINKIHDTVDEVLDPEYFWAEKKHNDLILIPTGDGYGIALNPTKHDDKVILKIASDLFKAITREGDIEIKIRMGVAKGRNIVQLCKNDVMNIFGYGVNLAHRVMSVAEPNQILVHKDFASSMQTREFTSDLKELEKPFSIKHSQQIYCYNYYKKNEFGIKINEVNK